MDHLVAGAGSAQLKDRAAAVRAAGLGRAVQEPVGAQNQTRVGVYSVHGVVREGVKHLEAAAIGEQLENGAVEAAAAVVIHAAVGGPVECSVVPLDQSAVGGTPFKSESRCHW